jgi:flagellar biosynthesis protein FlhF
MRLKSFFAETIEAAMAEAGKDLGADAMLLNSRRSEPELQHLGAYEVVCAVAPAIHAVDPPESSASTTELAREMARLREQMETLTKMMVRSRASFSDSASRSGSASRPELARLHATLCDADISADVAEDIVLRLSLQTESTNSARQLAANARSELASFILTNPALSNGGVRTVAFVGPPGSGKTTSLVKLAIRECLAKRRPCSLFTIDTLRIAAADQLRSYATILGVPFQVLETPASLSLALDRLRPNETAFIDTPGFAATDMADAANWAGTITSRLGMDIHLVLPASMRAADQKRIADQYEIFSPRKLLFTKLDETEALGGMITLSLLLRKPISFLSSGQQIPEDLEYAAADRIAGLVLHRLAGGEQVNAAAA